MKKPQSPHYILRLINKGMVSSTKRYKKEAVALRKKAEWERMYPNATIILDVANHAQ